VVLDDLSDPPLHYYLVEEMVAAAVVEQLGCLTLVEVVAVAVVEQLGCLTLVEVVAVAV
jgi:hypothetical protein